MQAAKKGTQSSLRKQTTGSATAGSFKAKLADKVFTKIKKTLGLDRCRLALIGFGPPRAETVEFFASIDVPLFELYGLSVGCCGACVTVTTACTPC